MVRRSLAIVGMVGLASIVYVTHRSDVSTSIAPSAAFAATASGASNDVVPRATFTPVGLMVQLPAPDSDESFPQMAFMGTFSNTRVAVAMDYPEGGMIELLREQCTIESFRDDQGGDLLGDPGAFGPIEMMPDLNAAGTRLVFTVGTSQLPRPNATRFDLKGKVAVRVAEDTVDWDASKVQFREGQAVSAGPYEFKITRAGKSEWSDSWSIDIESKEEMGAVIDYAIVDAKGSVHKLSRTMSMGGFGSWTYTLECETQVDAGTFRLHAWKDPKAIEVPFSVSAGLGLR